MVHGSLIKSTASLVFHCCYSAWRQAVRNDPLSTLTRDPAAISQSIFAYPTFGNVCRLSADFALRIPAC